MLLDCTPETSRETSNSLSQLGVLPTVSYLVHASVLTPPFRSTLLRSSYLSQLSFGLFCRHSYLPISFGPLDTTSLIQIYFVIASSASYGLKRPEGWAPDRLHCADAARRIFAAWVTHVPALFWVGMLVPSGKANTFSATTVYSLHLAVEPGDGSQGRLIRMPALHGSFLSTGRAEVSVRCVRVEGS